MRKQKFNNRSVELAFDKDSAVRGRIFYGLAAGTILFGLIGGWAANAELSGAVIAIGQVKVDKDLRAIQHLDGGIVREIAVQKGDVVDQGQLLLRLDDTQIKSEQKIIRNQLQELMARQARLVAERDGAPSLDVPKDEIGLNVGETLAFRGEVRLFDGNAETRRSKKEQLELGIAQLDQEIAGMKAQQQANAS
jgi:multidrug efflux pump subunit AcrA (membrane-fusion protein)